MLLDGGSYSFLNVVAEFEDEVDVDVGFDEGTGDGGEEVIEEVCVDGGCGVEFAEGFAEFSSEFC